MMVGGVSITQGGTDRGCSIEASQKPTTPKKESERELILYYHYTKKVRNSCGKCEPLDYESQKALAGQP
jgi:hypothetical protein